MEADIRFKWTDILYSVVLFRDSKTDFLRISAADVKWSPVDDFRACQTIDISDYTNVSNHVDRLYFYFKKIKNYEVSVFIEEKVRHTRRPLVSSKEVYSGPYLVIKDLYKPSNLKTVHKLSQQIDSELDKGKNCKNYPYKHYRNYRQCDEEYVFNQLHEKFKITPFWATYNMSSVTKLR